MGNVFWDALRECGATLLLSPYPVGIDYKGLVALAEGQGVQSGLAFDMTGRNAGKAGFIQTAVDPTGSQDPTHSFLGCPFGGVFLQVKERCLWACQVAAHHTTLSRAFGMELEADDDDKLPLRTITDVGQIEDFRRRCHPTCRYCNNDHLRIAPWEKSKQDAGEWIDESTETTERP